MTTALLISRTSDDIRHTEDELAKLAGSAGAHVLITPDIHHLVADSETGTRSRN